MKPFSQKAVMAAALLFAALMGSCTTEDPGIVNICPIPTVIRTSPANGDSNVVLSKTSAVMAATRTGAVRIISATFSTPMDPYTISTSSFTVRQGATPISGSVSYSDSTAFFMAPNDLAPNMSYTCTITSGARDLAGTALAGDYVWTFTTLAATPPTLVSPSNGAVDQPTNPRMIWNAVSGAGSYRLQISLSPAFVGMAYDDSTLTGTSPQMSGLRAATTYYWRVNAKISGVTSAYSTIWSFTTIAAPAAPVLVAPADADINIPTSPVLSWLSSARADTYGLQISTSSTFATTVFNDSTLTGTSQPITGLTAGTTYYWRVNAKNVAGTSAYSTRSFTTIAAGTPTLVSPVNGAVNQAVTTTLFWNSVPGAATYRLQVSTSSIFATTVYNDSTRTNTSQAITGLAFGTTYYWRVNAKISGATSAYSTIWSFTTLATPAAPVLMAPVDSAGNVATSPTLSWNASTGAATYRLQVSTSATFATTLFNDSTLTGTSQSITGLTSGITYYWRVNAKNAAGTSAYATRRFTTIAAGTPTLVSPVNGAVSQAVNPTLIWNAVTGAATYRLQVSTSATFAATVYDDSTRTGTSQALSGLAVATTYYWRVNAKISGGTGAYSDIWSFTTIAAPAAPVLVAPVDAAGNVATSPTLSWNASTGAATYDVQVSTSATFATTLFNDSTITGTSQPITGLAAGTTYYWRVNAKNVAGTSVYSSRSFTTIAPGTPTLVSPVNGAVSQAVNPTLSWNSVPGAATYRLQVSLSPGFVSTVYDDSARTNTSQAISGLAVATTYYWRVNAKISGGTSAYSDVWSFTTLAAPAAPVLVSPAATAQNQATALTLSWLASTGAATYDVQVSTSATFATTLFNDSTLTGLSQSLTGLALGTTYYWRVNAKNAAGTSAYSARSFTTAVAAPLPPVLAAPALAAINISTSPTLSWNASTGAATYRLQVSTGTTFATTLFNDSTLTGLSQSITGLAVGTTYYWRVNAKNAAGTSAYSTVWSFTTAVAAPLPPTLVAPADAAINISTSPALSWNASTGAATYRLQVSTGNTFAATVFNDSTLTGLSQSITGLSLGTTYYWRVNAKNAAGTSAYSTVRSFTTAVAAPLPPVLAAPADAAINISTSPALSWLASTGAATYRLQVDTSSVFASMVFNDSTLTGLSQTLAGLTNGRTYYWRVNAKNAGGTSAYSATWRFTVVALPPPSVNLGVAARFGSFGGNAGITNQGTITQINNGSIGTTAASTLITGFHDATTPPSNVFTETSLNIGAVQDTIYTATAPPGSVPGAVATQALADAQTAFNFLKGLPPGPDAGAGELGGLTLAPGTYTSASGTFKITLVDLTLDAQGDPNARFVFQMASSLTVGSTGPTGARSVILINGAQAKNVFWVAGTGTSGAATINYAGGGTMVGTIIAYSGVTLSAPANSTNPVPTRLEGRALGLNASVTMVNTIINVPLP